MDRYWDLTEKQRASLTDVQLEALLAVERMEKGVVEPPPPVLADEEVPKIPTLRVFGIKAKGRYSTDDILDVVFDTVERAQAFLDLCPIRTTSDWQLGDRQYVCTIAGASILPLDFPSMDAVAAIKPQLAKAETAKNQNAKAREEYTKAMTTFSDAATAVRQDYYRCRELDRANRRVVETFDKYIQTAGGSEEIAAKFLMKAYPDAAQVFAAFEWAGREFPNVAAAGVPA